jgi:hypothetical protein
LQNWSFQTGNTATDVFNFHTKSASCAMIKCASDY